MIKIGKYSEKPEIRGSLSNLTIGKFCSMPIPKVIHQIWTGSKEIPEKYLKFCDSWKKFNPEWQVIFWKDEQLKKQFKKMYPDTKYFYEADINTVMKTDILRFELLRLYGGFYADLDMECLKPLDEFCKDEFTVGWEWVGEPRSVSTGFIGCAANHSITRAMLFHIFSSLYTKTPTTKWDQLLACGPHALVNIILTKGIKPYPQKYFAPIPPLASAKEYYTDVKEAYVKHYFYGGQPGGWPEYYGENEKEAQPPVSAAAIPETKEQRINLRIDYPRLIKTSRGKVLAQNTQHEAELRAT